MSLMAAVLGLLMQIGLPFPGPGMVGAAPSVTFVQTGGSSINAIQDLTVTKTVTAGDGLYVICAEWTGGTIIAPTVSDTPGANTWSAVSDTGLNSSNFSSRSWMSKAVAASSGSTAMKCHFGDGNGHVDMIFVEYTNGVSLDSGATHFTSNNSATTGVTHSVTSTVTDTLVTYSFVAANGSSTLTTPSGFTVRQTNNGGSGNSMAIFDKSAVSAGAQSVANVGTGTTPLHSGLIGIHP